VKAFHPAGPLPSYEVATIKPENPRPPAPGVARRITPTLRAYIASAYGVQLSPNAAPGCAGCQVIGGPAWLDQDHYDIEGKLPDAVRDAMQKMTLDQRREQTEMVQQSLLAARFHLKVHFETREMPVYELVPAKGGLKVTAVDPPAQSVQDPIKPPKPGEPRSPAATLGWANGAMVLTAKATTMESFAHNLHLFAPETTDRPVIDRTGFEGNFELKNFRFLAPSLAAASGTPEGQSDAEPIVTAMEQQLGIKLVRAKGPVEVVVIDSIDRPTEN